MYVLSTLPRLDGENIHHAGRNPARGGPVRPLCAPAPAVPPTPPVPLTALLAREDLGLRQIAGPPVGPDTVIHWAHTSEMADPYPYLLGGELLLTAGVHATESAGTGPYYDDYVARVVAAGGAALGFGVAPVHDTVPRALVAACERHGLPLLEVPPHSTFSGVTRAVWQLMAQARHAELRRVSEAQQGLATAAARPYPVPAVLRQLAQRTGGWAVLSAPDGTEVGRAGPDPSAEVSAAMAQLMRIVRPGETRLFPAPTSAADTVGGTQLAAYALGGGQGYALGTAVGHRDPGDHTIAGVAVVLLSLLTGEHQTTAGRRARRPWSGSCSARSRPTSRRCSATARGAWSTPHPTARPRPRSPSARPSSTRPTPSYAPCSPRTRRSSRRRAG